MKFGLTLMVGLLIGALLVDTGSLLQWAIVIFAAAIAFYTIWNEERMLADEGEVLDDMREGKSDA